jgi:hypothetical protein
MSTMMEQRRLPSFTSSPYQHMVDYPASHDLTRCNSHDPVISEPPHGSFHERDPFRTFGREQSDTRSLSAPVDAFDPSLLEGHSCGSPLSTSSSISHNESVPTPPYTGLPMYSAVEHPFHRVRNTSTHTSWNDEPEPMWHSTYAEPHPWGGQKYVLPCHSGPSYEQLPLQPTHTYLPPVGGSSAPLFLGFNEAPPPYPWVQTMDSAPFAQENANNTVAHSSGGSDSESDDSDYDDDSSQKSSRSTSKGSHANASVLKLGPWMTPDHSYANTPEQRHYHCPMIEVSGIHPCNKKFVRPEHLRRHVKTVHGSLQPYRCKVPDCDRAFSRGDNLRDHYWTHLSRGGRAGKNRKMEFLELKAILGPKERKLARRLKTRLNKQREKQMKSKL